MEGGVGGGEVGGRRGRGGMGGGEEVGRRWGGDLYEGELGRRIIQRLHGKRFTLLQHREDELENSLRASLFLGESVGHP